MEKLLKGNAVVAAIKEELLAEVAKLQSHGIVPLMVIVRCGAKADDIAYENSAKKRFANLGIGLKVVELPQDIGQDDFIRELHKLNEDKEVHGVLVFRPLPKQINENVIKYHLDSVKDVDCLTPINIAKLFAGDSGGYPPCTPEAVIELLDFYGIDLVGKKVTLIGRSMVVGKPLAILLLQRHATVTICHTRTRDLAQAVRDADIVIAAAGSAKMVGSDFISPGQIVIDVGINVDQDGNLCGDVDFDGVVEKVSQITPVPGGIGTVTTSCLAKHLVAAARNLSNI